MDLTNISGGVERSPEPTKRKGSDSLSRSSNKRNRIEEEGEGLASDLTSDIKQLSLGTQVSYKEVVIHEQVRIIGILYGTYLTSSLRSYAGFLLLLIASSRCPVAIRVCQLSRNCNIPCSFSLHALIRYMGASMITENFV